MPSCSMRPNESANPPGVQVSRLVTVALAANTSAAPRATASAPLPRRRRGSRLGATSESRAAAGQQHQQHGKCRAVRCNGHCDQGDKAGLFASVEVICAEQEKIKCEHREPGENIREQDRGKPGQGGEYRQRGNNAGKQSRPSAKAMHTHDQRDHPHRERALPEHHRPERQWCAGIEDQPVGDGAARHEIGLVPAGEVAAGVILQQGKAVPDCRRAEQCHRTTGWQTPTGRGRALASESSPDASYCWCLDTALTVS